MIETTKYAEVTKKNIPITNKENYLRETETTTKPEIVTQLVNEMKALIQEIKTIRTVTENKPLAKKDTNIEIATNKEKQTKNKENPLLKYTQLLGHHRPHPKVTLQRTPHLTNRDMALN